MSAPNRIDRMFAARRAADEAAAIFYLTAGCPDLATTERTIDVLVDEGADLIELGMPFSDPVADGPTIQRASQRALEGGVKLRKVLELAGRVRARHADLPILLFTAYNPIFHMGDETFVAEAARVGLDALLVPDLPPEEADDLRRHTDAHGLHMVFLVAPTTTPERAEMLARVSGGFVYYVSLKGVTGARAALPKQLPEKVAALKAMTDRPVAVGFGVSQPEQAGAIAAFADGVIVGSALIQAIGEEADDPDREQRVRAFVGPVVRAVHKA